MEELAAATMLMYPFSFGTKSYVVASWGTYWFTKCMDNYLLVGQEVRWEWVGENFSSLQKQVQIPPNSFLFYQILSSLFTPLTLFTFLSLSLFFYYYFIDPEVSGRA